MLRGGEARGVGRRWHAGRPECAAAAESEPGPGARVGAGDVGGDGGLQREVGVGAQRRAGLSALGRECEIHILLIPTSALSWVDSAGQSIFEPSSTGC
jgi:hypothetical protein